MRFGTGGRLCSDVVAAISATQSAQWLAFAGSRGVSWVMQFMQVRDETRRDETGR